jgi:antitoxin YefM
MKRTIMKAVTYTDAKKNLKALIQKVCKDSEPAVIVSDRVKEKAVLISFEDYQAMEETAYLLGSPANRAHLEKSLKQAQCAKLIDFPAEDL